MAMQTISGSGNPSQQTARVLRAQWNRYMQAYTPVEDRLIGSLGLSDAPQTAEDAEAASVRGQQAVGRIQERYGLAQVDPELAQRVSQSETTLAGTSAFNQTRLAEVDRRDSVRQGMVEVGQSLLNQSTGGLSAASGMYSQRQATNRQIDAQRSAQRSSTAASLASAGIMALATIW